MISQEARALNLREGKGEGNSPFQSLCHTGLSILYLPSPPPWAPDPHWLLPPSTEKMVWRLASGWLRAPLPTHLQEEATQSLERGGGEGGEVGRSCALQNQTHLFGREDAAALEPHKLAPERSPTQAVMPHRLHPGAPPVLPLCSALAENTGLCPSTRQGAQSW